MSVTTTVLFQRPQQEIATLIRDRLQIPKQSAPLFRDDAAPFGRDVAWVFCRCEIPPVDGNWEGMG